ncbi:MAG: PAS domain-containing protein, partial [Cyclobacteriaceae bacterium]
MNNTDHRFNPEKDSTGARSQTGSHLYELLEATQESAKIGAWEANLVTKELFWTNEMYRIHNIRIGTKLNLEHSISFFHKDHRATIAHAIDEAISLKKPWDLELKLITATGREIWVRALGEPVIKNKKVKKLRGFFENIDRRKIRELKYKKNQQLLKMALEVSKIGVWNWNAESNELIWDEGMFRNFGVDPKHFKGTYEDFINCVHKDDKEKVNQ